MPFPEGPSDLLKFCQVQFRGAVGTDKVTYDDTVDCDGDGIPDPFCAISYVQAYLSSANGCLPKVLQDYGLIRTQDGPANRQLCPAM